MLEWSEALDGVPRRATLEQYLRLSLRRAEIQIQKEQQKVEKKFSNFDPIDGDLPGLVHSKTRRIWQWGAAPFLYHELPSKSYLFLKSRFSRH